MGNRILIVGEAFGREEEKQGKPFVGRSGQLLRSALNQLGVDPETIDFTNVCMFRPQDKNGNNRKPNKVEIESGRERLVRECYEYNKIICLGKVASDALYWVPESWDVSSCWHPAYVLRNMSKYKEWLRQLSTALGVDNPLIRV